MQNTYFYTKFAAFTLLITLRQCALRNENGLKTGGNHKNATIDEFDNCKSIYFLKDYSFARDIH